MDERGLKQLSLFSELSTRDRRRIAPLVEEIEVAPGHELANEGELAYELFVIADGTAAVSQDGRHIAELGAGDFFGEIGVLDDARRRTSTVVASSPMRLYILQGHEVRFIQRELPEIAAQLRAAIETRLSRDKMR